MDYDQLLRRVREHTGLSERPIVESAVRAVTEALGALIDHEHRDEIARILPAEVGEMLRRPAPDRDASGATFLRTIARIEHLPPGFAVEHGTAVLEAIGTELRPEERRLLAARLPEEMRDWLEPRTFRSPPPRAPHEHAEEEHRVADAEPGSHHPVSEAAPPPAQSGSVAASADPHASTRLSSAHGLTQEREREDLAEAHPRGERTISETR